jgi:hypothetical protein
MGGSYSVSASSATTVVSQTLVNVEQFCAAVASNTVTITLKTPKDCQGPNDAGTDIVAPDITQYASANQTCNNQSTLAALLNATIKNELTASMASEMAGITWLGASLPPIWEKDNVSTNAVNTIIQTTDYSALQQCRSKASNMISVYINDCKLNRDVGEVDGKVSTFSQVATADLTSCVQNSNVMANLTAHISNIEAASDTKSDPWVQMVATLGNVIMTCAVAAAVGGVLFALISGLVAVFRYREETKRSIAKGIETTADMKIIKEAADAKRAATLAEMKVVKDAANEKRAAAAAPPPPPAPSAPPPAS